MTIYLCVAVAKSLKQFSVGIGVVGRAFLKILRHKNPHTGRIAEEILGQIGVLDEMMPSVPYKLLEIIATMCPNWLTTADSDRFLWTSERLFELGMDIGGRRKTRSAEGGIRHRLSMDVRGRPPSGL
jgi:hypothetical protein